ncbi:MAG: PaaI family thioesterase [Actinomycetes bacterium]
MGGASTRDDGVDHDLVRTRVDDALATSRPDFGAFFLFRLLDLSITYDDDAQSTCIELPYADFLGNPQGSLHGGVITTVMDISMGHLCHRYLGTAVTVEMQTRFFRPVTGPSRCEGRLLRAGRRIVHLESRLYDEHGRLAASATATWHRLDQSEAPRSAPDGARHERPT